MEEGAWNPENVGNNNQLAAGPRAQPAVIPLPPMYNNPASDVKREPKVYGFVIVGLRVVQFIFTLIGFAVMSSNKANAKIYGEGVVNFKFSFNESFLALVAMDVIVCVYALVQMILSLVLSVSVGSLISPADTGFSFFTFLFDLVVMLALMGASAPAAYTARRFLLNYYCESVPGYCTKFQASIAISFFAIAFLAVCCILYPVRLLRLAKK